MSFGTSKHFLMTLSTDNNNNDTTTQIRHHITITFLLSGYFDFLNTTNNPKTAMINNDTFQNSTLLNNKENIYIRKVQTSNSLAGYLDFHE